MRRIIEHLKEQREKAEKTFIENSLIKRAASANSPIPDTDSYLEDVYELSQAISILENHQERKGLVKMVDNAQFKIHFNIF